MSEFKNDLSFSKQLGRLTERKKIKDALIANLEKLLVDIVKKEGYQEMADGCDQALDEVRRYFESTADPDWIE